MDLSKLVMVELIKITKAMRAGINAVVNGHVKMGLYTWSGSAVRVQGQTVGSNNSSATGHTSATAGYGVDTYMSDSLQWQIPRGC